MYRGFKCSKRHIYGLKSEPNQWFSEHLKVHYATFYRPVSKQRDRALDTRNSSLQDDF